MRSRSSLEIAQGAAGAIPARVASKAREEGMIPLLAVGYAGAPVLDGARMLEGPISSVLKGVSPVGALPLDAGAGISAAPGVPGGAEGAPRSADGGTAIENDGLYSS